MQVGSHALNKDSSRSHSLFTIYLESSRSMLSSYGCRTRTLCGKITFVDLAGSEKLKKSKQSSGESIKETSNINRSLFTLGKVKKT